MREVLISVAVAAALFAIALGAHAWLTLSRDCIPMTGGSGCSYTLGTMG